MDRLNQLFEQFLRERTYINNVTISTIEWYREAWKAFTRARPVAPIHPESHPLIGDLQNFVVALRARGIRPVTFDWVAILWGLVSPQVLD